MILEVTCSDYGIIQFVRILRIVFQMIQVIGPILAMLSLAIIFFRLMSNSYDYDSDKKYEKDKARIKNCIIALLVTFFLPVLVNLTMEATFMSNSFQVSACWKAAKDYEPGGGSYKENPNINKDKTGTFIINPSQYSGKDIDPNASIRNGNSGEINQVSSSSLKDAFVDLAVAQKKDPSAKGGKKYWSYMGYKSRVGWCASFVTWVAHNAEYNGQKVSSILSHKGAGCTSWISFCKRNKKTTWHKGNTYTPQRGDLILFDWNGGGEDHIGIVTSVTNTAVHTIEGNNGDRVRNASYARYSSKIYGYCSW